MSMKHRTVLNNKAETKSLKLARKRKLFKSIIKDIWASVVKI